MIKYTTALLLLPILGLQSQTNNQTSSPYSLFGLGRLNEEGPGITNGLANSGLAVPSTYEVNNLNPASYADIPLNTFLFDIGGKQISNSFSNADNSQKISTFSFSNMGFAFALSPKSGIGLMISPYSDVGYNLSGISGQIDGSADTYTSFISGKGGLSNLAINYGRKITEHLSLGISASYYFGKITETEAAYIGNDELLIESNNYYRGFRFAAGLQFQATTSLRLAALLKLSSSLRGFKDFLSYKTVNNVQTLLDDQVNAHLDRFHLPFEAGIGASYRFGRLNFNADLRRAFWNATNMTDNLGTFADQTGIALGIEYGGRMNSLDWINHVKVRGGFNADNGYLEVNGRRISNYKASLGLGIPFSNRATLNLSYSMARRGAVSNTLVREQYNTLTINLSLSDLWFQKRKYD